MEVVIAWTDCIQLHETWWVHNAAFAAWSFWHTKHGGTILFWPVIFWNTSDFMFSGMVATLLWNLSLFSGLIYGVFIIVVCAWAGWSCSTIHWLCMALWCLMCSVSRFLVPLCSAAAIQKRTDRQILLWSTWSDDGRYTFHQINSVRMGGECLNLATASRWRRTQRRCNAVSSPTRYVFNAEYVTCRS